MTLKIQHILLYTFKQFRRLHTVSLTVSENSLTHSSYSIESSSVTLVKVMPPRWGLDLNLLRAKFTVYYRV